MGRILAIFCVLCGIPCYFHCYNLDVHHPIIIENTDASQTRSYFGYSVVLNGKLDNKWIKIGAPRATYNGPSGPVNNSGVVYHCPYMNECQLDERLNYSANNLEDSWTGGVMDISYEYDILGVSSPGRHIPYPPYMRGTMFMQDLKKKIFEESFSPLQLPNSKDGLPYYSRALTGFSMHFLRNKSEVLVGAPGVYNYLGTVFRVKNIDKAQDQWECHTINPAGKFYEYSGYAVTSGYFYNDWNLYYVTGLPRGFDKLVQGPYGAVGIFTFTDTYPDRRTYKTEVKSKLKEVIYGTQYGEYFGSALATGDLNGDGLDDLVVGSPMRRNDKAGFDHGSVYVFYGRHDKLENKQDNRIDGTASGSRFGTAVMVLGDLDNDGFRELAVSAPNGDSSGAVYIYTFDKAMGTLKVSQTILGDDLYPGLRGFGTSFSKAVDIDNNDFLDFAVGSPLSGHAIILRSKPTVSVNASINAPSIISKSSTTFKFKCCYRFTGLRHANLSIIRNLTIDADFNRFYFENQAKDQLFEEKPIHIWEMREKCENIYLNKTTGVQNYDAPIIITLTYRLQEDPAVNTKNPVVIANASRTQTNDTFCKKCPVLSKESRQIEAKRIFWDHKCDHNGRKEPCKSRLEVNASFTNLREDNSFILGSKKLVNLEVSVENKGDPAFSPLLQIFMPNGVSLRVKPVDCQNSDNNSIRCDGGDILYKKVTYSLQFNVNSEETNDLRFHLNASTITENIGGRNISLDLKLKRVADFLITGYSKESSYFYEMGKPALIQNIFKIEKVGPSPTQPVEVSIIIPYKIKGLDGKNTQFVKIADQNKTSLENPLVKCDDIFMDFKGRPRREINEAKVDSSQVYYLDCTMDYVECALLKCMVGPFEGLQLFHAEILLDMEVDFQLDMASGQEKVMEMEQVIIATKASVSANFSQTGNRSDHTQILNVVSLHKELVIPLWMLIASATVGLIILICVIIGLAKAGFFERKKHKMVLQMKEEAEEEEKLIEEIIRKELDPEETGEGGPAFRYMTPTDLQSYWKRLENESQQNGPLLENSAEECLEDNSAPSKSKNN